VLAGQLRAVKWLTLQQKQQLREQLNKEEQRKSITSLSAILTNPQVWLLVAVYFAVMLAVNTLAFWMPLIHGAGIGSDGKVGLLSAVPLAGAFYDRLWAFVRSSP
jgi:sugar phosphate permease